MAEILQLLPPVILAIAALITAITGLIKVLKSKKKYRKGAASRPFPLLPWLTLLYDPWISQQGYF